jgi:signal peptidase I
MKLDFFNRPVPENIAPEEGGMKNFIKTLIYAAVFAGVIRSFFFEPFHIPSSSMKPGLLIGDYIFVSKYSYGYSRFSFPFSLNLFSGRIAEKQPKRGDVAVFRLPSDTSVNYIKRIIGLPGDKIKVVSGQVFINDKAVPKVAAGSFSEEGEEIAEFKETLPDGREIKVLDQYPNTPQDDTGVYSVPAGHYFMMGDNRDNSQDSRFQEQVGYIPKENLIGKAGIIFLSVERPVWQFWHWHNSIRFNRFFKKIK